MPIYKLRIVSDKLCESASVKATNPKETVRYLLDHCFPPEEAWRERVVAVFTNRALEVTGHIEVATGGTASTCIDIKVIAKAALDTLAEGVILAHNHPSDSVHSRSNSSTTSSSETRSIFPSTKKGQ